MTLHEKNMARIDAVNTAPTELVHMVAQSELRAWRDGVTDGGGYIDLIAADLEQMDARGIDRPMCCGVFLDWKSSNSK